MTDKRKKVLFHCIFILCFAAGTISRLLSSTQYRYGGFRLFLESLFSLLPLCLLYIACILYSKNSKPMVAMILASLCAAWRCFQFFRNIGPYRYYSYRYYYHDYGYYGSNSSFITILGLFGSLAFIAGIILLIIYGINKNFGDEPKNLFKFIMIAGIVSLSCMAISNITFITNLIISIINHFKSAKRYGYQPSFNTGYIVYSVFQNIILLIPEGFLGIGLWLVAGIGHENERETTKEEYYDEETLIVIPSIQEKSEDNRKPQIGALVCGIVSFTHCWLGLTPIITGFISIFLAKKAFASGYQGKMPKIGRTFAILGLALCPVFGALLYFTGLIESIR